MNTTLGVYGRLLLSHWRWLVWSVLLTLAVTTVFLVLWPPLYRTQATVFVRTPGDVSRVQDGGDGFAQGRAGTYAALAKSTSLSSRVISDLGLDLAPETLSKRIRGTHRPGTALVDISLRAPSAADAQRQLTVLLSELSATVRSMESVPGSVVPRAELVVVDPPGPAVRVVGWGASVYLVLLGAGLAGLVLGALAVVLRSVIKSPADAQEPAAVPDVDSSVFEPPAQEVVMAPAAPYQASENMEATPTGAGVGRHRRTRRSSKPQT